MDATDRKILAALQDDGRLTLTELAARIPLSVSRCQRRPRDLEAKRVVRAYRSDIEPEMVGLGFRAIVFATMRQGDRDTVAAFEDAVAAVPEVISARRLFGDPDYLLHVVAADLAAYQRLYDERLGALPGVQRLTSTLVMKEVVRDRGLPLSPRYVQLGSRALLPRHRVEQDAQVRPTARVTAVLVEMRSACHGRQQVRA